jgi:uncharacterized protein YjiS (DUF1127 family)
MTRSATSLMNISATTFVRDFVRSCADLIKVVRDRRDILSLAEMDERMLKDIGLSRSDVDEALAEPFYQSPSWVLVRCMEQKATRPAKVAPPRQSRPVVPFVMDERRCA